MKQILKHLTLFALTAIFSFAAFLNISAADSDVDSSFVSRLIGGLDSDFVGVESVAVQPDGKMVIGGTFKSFASRLQSGIGRTNADGSPDYAFNPNVNNSVYTVAVQTDGKILIGGDFTSVGGQARTRLARLNADGSLDTTFGDLNVNARVWTIVLQTDGKILVGGEFNGVNGQVLAGAARLNANGTIDTSFVNPDLGGSGSGVYAMAVQPDGKILVGGNNIFVIGSQYRYFGRINANGTADASFPDVVGVGDVQQIKIQADGKIMISGSFAFIGPSGNSVNRKAIARLNADGSNDVSFGNVTEVSASTIYDFTVFPDGKIIIGGTFSYQNSTRGGLARINSNGTLDATYDANLDSQVRSLGLQTNGKLAVGGYFRFVGGQSRRNFVRLNADASLDLLPKDISLNHQTSSSRGRVRAITIQPDGKILVGGYFSSASGRTRRGVVRLNPDSTIDTTFTDPGITNEVFYGVSAITVQTDGKILVGGDFRTVNGLDRRFLIRLNADGTLDNSFTATISDTVFSIVIQPDGKILIGGVFSEVGGQSRSRMARLNANGSLDAGFNRGSDFAVVYSMILQADGKIIAPGSQVGVNGSLLRYNADGTRDASFSTPDVSGSSIVKVLRQPDGKILIGGPFSTVNGTARRHVARLNSDGTLDASLQNTGNAFGSVGDLALQPDGKIIISGDFTPVSGDTARRYLARLNVDGTYDTAFNPLPNNYVYNVVLQSDGKILAGGDFQEVAGITQDYITRLLGSATVNPCVPGIINFAQTINGNLGANGCTNFNSEPEYMLTAGKEKNKPELRSSAAIVRFSDYYSFNATAGQQIAISMNSGIFDTYLYLLNSGGAVIAENDDIVTGNTNSRIPATGFFTIPATGTYTIRATSYNENSTGAYTLNLTTNNPQSSVRAPFDFDGDGKTDISIFRPAAGEWWYLRSSDGSNRAFQFGQSTDKIVPADYTGDGKTDLAFWRPSTGQWFILRSEDSSFYAFPFGASGDVPVPADYDGDGKADPAIFRPATLTWFISKSTGGTQITTFGATGDIPTVADYDGDGKGDIAIFRPNGANGAEWWIQRSSNNSVLAAQFGASTDKPVQGDYTGDGKSDIALWRPSNGSWFILRSEDFSFYGFPFGTSGDVPVPGDYDGDGRFDAGVFRPSGTNWFIQRSSAGTLIQQFGTTGDSPVPTAFVP